MDMRVAELIDDGGRWEMSRLENLLQPIEIEEVTKVERLSHLVSDMRYWKFDQKGEYSVKSGYLVASSYFDSPSSSSNDENTRWWKFIWSFDLPQRVRIFTWRVFRNIIPTELNLHKHHVPIFGRCGWCKKDWGSTAHELIFCDKVRHLWMGFDFWNILKKWEGRGIWEIGGAMQEGASRQSFEEWIMGMWLVWKVLCAEKHKNQRCPWSDLKNECMEYIQNYASARQQAACAARVLPLEGGQKWEYPRRGRYRLDVDYAVDEVSGNGGVGAILRDDRGKICFAVAKPVAKSATTLHGELKALMHGICKCIEEEISPVEVYTDSLLAVIVVSEEKEEASVLCEEFFEFFSMVKDLNVISISHVRREANRAAHELARFARSLVTTIVWLDSWPHWLSSIVIEDAK